jgi:hypothetical protein
MTYAFDMSERLFFNYHFENTGKSLDSTLEIIENFSKYFGEAQSAAKMLEGERK